MALLEQPTIGDPRRERASIATSGHAPFGPRSGSIAIVLLVLFGAFFVVRAWPQIEAPFGDSHDGRNAGTWALASRALRDDGVIASRGGAELAEHAGTYAHHPPLIIAETAVAETIGGEEPWVSRLPAWLGSLATLALLYLLLRQRGIGPIATAAGIMIAFGSQMFFVYGTMLDTLQTSLPFAVGFLIVWSRDEPEGCPHRRRWPLVVLAALLVFSSWEGALLVAGSVAFDVVWSWRRERGLRCPPALWGLLIGVGLVAAWLWWAEGSFTPIFDQFRTRAGERSTAPGFADLLRSQRAYLDRTFGAGLIVAAIPGLVLAIRSSRLRRLTVVVLTTTVVYPIVMRDAAFHHDYWNYWLLLTFAISFAALVEVILEHAARRQDRGFLAIIGGGCVVLAVVISAFGATSQRSIADRTDMDAGSLARAQGPSIQYLAGSQALPANWFTYYTGHPDHLLDTVPAIKRAANRTPDKLVLLRCGTERLWLTRSCRELRIATGQYATVAVTRLATLASGSR